MTTTAEAVARAVTTMDGDALVDLVVRDVLELLTAQGTALSADDLVLVRLAVRATHLRVVGTMQLALSCQ